MKVKELIEKLSQYNPEAKVDVVTYNLSEKFTITCGSSDGCTNKDCHMVSFYVDRTCNNKSQHWDRNEGVCY